MKCLFGVSPVPSCVKSLGFPDPPFTESVMGGRSSPKARFRRSWIFCSFSQASKISALKSVFFLYRYVRSVSLHLPGTVLQMKLTSLLYLAPCFWKYFSLLQYFSLFCQAVEFHFPSLPYAPSQKHVCNALTGPHSDDT